MFRCWNTTVKLVWGVPRSTHTYFVEHLLGLGLPTVSHKLKCQYVGYFQKLKGSASKEVRILSEIVARDAQSVTGRNLQKIKQEYSLDPWSSPVSSFKQTDVSQPIPETDSWRIEFLGKLLAQRIEMELCDDDSTETSKLIDSLCST